jgi:hypothetical protein
MDPASAREEVRRIQGRVLAHKKGAARERGRMRRELRKLDEFRAMCAEFGITLVIESSNQQKIHTETLEGGQSDNRQDSSNQAEAGEHAEAG